MYFRKIELEEYIDRLPKKFKENKTSKTYLEELLKDDIAEYYLIDNKLNFFFYKYEDNLAELCVNEKREVSLFDSYKTMENIFKFLKSNGYNLITIVLLKNDYHKRHTYARNYRF